jgi:hypothetical protein
MSTFKQIEANRRNAQLSTGARTTEGRERSSMNAVKHGYTGQTLHLPASEAEAYKSFSEGFLKEIAPVGTMELDLAYSIMQNRWRKHQLACTESGLYTIGFEQHAADGRDESLLRALIFEEKRKDFDRLRRYENAIQRTIVKESAQLEALQTARKTREAEQKKDAIALLTHFTTLGQSWNPAEFGFDLSIEQIQQLEQREFILNRARTAQSAM